MAGQSACVTVDFGLAVMFVRPWSLTLALLPAVSWLFVGAMHARSWFAGWSPHNGPGERELNYFRISFAWGALLCAIAAAIGLVAWTRRRFDVLSLLIVLASIGFLFSWYAETGVDGVYRMLLSNGRG